MFLFDCFLLADQFSEFHVLLCWSELSLQVPHARKCLSKWSITIWPRGEQGEKLTTLGLTIDLEEGGGDEERYYKQAQPQDDLDRPEARVPAVSAVLLGASSDRG